MASYLAFSTSKVYIVLTCIHTRTGSRHLHYSCLVHLDAPGKLNVVRVFCFKKLQVDGYSSVRILCRRNFDICRDGWFWDQLPVFFETLRVKGPSRILTTRLKALVRFRMQLREVAADISGRVARMLGVMGSFSGSWRACRQLCKAVGSWGWDQSESL